MPIGGPKIVVEIDCFCFYFPKMVNGKCKGLSKDHAWIFVGVERNRKSFADVVFNKDAKTLLAIIKRKIYPNSIIITEKKKLYSSLNREGYKHYTKSHKYLFAR